MAFDCAKVTKDDAVCPPTARDGQPVSLASRNNVNGRKESDAVSRATLFRKAFCQICPIRMA
jgi:hypothetical protein